MLRVGVGVLFGSKVERLRWLGESQELRTAVSGTQNALTGVDRGKIRPCRHK